MDVENDLVLRIDDTARAEVGELKELNIKSTA